jgi:hypothetical protein
MFKIKKKHAASLSILLLFLGLTAAQAAVSEMDMDSAYASYIYYLEDDNSYGVETWENFIEGEGTTKASSLAAPSVNYAAAQIRYSSLDYIKGASAMASYDNTVYPEEKTGGFGGSLAEAYVGVSKTFAITNAGAASVTFTLEGSLFSSGTRSEAGYEFYGGDTYGNLISKEDWVSDGETEVNETLTFLYEFTPEDVSIGSVQLTLDLYIWALSGDEFFDDVDSEYLVNGYAETNFLNTLSIDSISGGIQSIGDEVPRTVPVPGAGMLLVSGLIGLASLRRARAM